jgi:hypothetical protein
VVRRNKKPKFDGGDDAGDDDSGSSSGSGVKTRSMK